jgi:hypothetical protein
MLVVVLVVEQMVMLEQVLPLLLVLVVEAHNLPEVLEELVVL